MTRMHLNTKLCSVIVCLVLFLVLFIMYSQYGIWKSKSSKLFLKDLSSNLTHLYKMEFGQLYTEEYVLNRVSVKQSLRCEKNTFFYVVGEMVTEYINNLEKYETTNNKNTDVYYKKALQFRKELLMFSKPTNYETKLVIADTEGEGSALFVFVNGYTWRSILGEDSRLKKTLLEYSRGIDDSKIDRITQIPSENTNSIWVSGGFDIGRSIDTEFKVVRDGKEIGRIIILKVLSHDSECQIIVQNEGIQINDKVELSRVVEN